MKSFLYCIFFLISASAYSQSDAASKYAATITPAELKKETNRNSGRRNGRTRNSNAGAKKSGFLY